MFFFIIVIAAFPPLFWFCAVKIADRWLDNTIFVHQRARGEGEKTYIKHICVRMCADEIIKLGRDIVAYGSEKFWYCEGDDDIILRFVNCQLRVPRFLKRKLVHCVVLYWVCNIESLCQGSRCLKSQSLIQQPRRVGNSSAAIHLSLRWRRPQKM